MKTVAILATFRDDDIAYSLCNVVNDQLKMLVNAGYKPKVLITEGFKPSRMFADPNVELRFLPDQIRQNTVVVDKTFHEDVDKLREVMTKHLADVDVVITHDIIYQPDALKHNVALRVVGATNSKLRFLHWIHSATSPYNIINLIPYFSEEYHKILQQHFPYSFYVFFNNWSIPRIAHEYSVGQELVRVVHHPTDYQDFANYHPLTRRIIEEKKLLEADYIDVYPARLDTGKQLEYPIKLMAALKRLGYAVRFISVDFHSSSNDPKDPKWQYRQELKDLALDQGLNEQEVTFTSEFDPALKVRVPTQIVSDLFDLSNIFFMSSSSESYSLVTQEAAMKGNLLILNRNFPPFREIFGPSALYFPCNSNVDPTNFTDGDTRVKFDNEAEAYEELAKLVVVHTMNKQEVTRRRLLRERNLDYVFKRELEPIILEACDREWVYSFKKV